MTFGQNEKGGIDEKDFEEYVMNSIIPLYPNAKNKWEKHVVLKVDSGPGRSNFNLLARLKLFSFVMYPGVPNTTHVTQESD